MENNFKKFANADIQPNDFSFNKDNLKKASLIKKMYPKNYKESSIMPLLTLAQEQNGGWVPKKAIEYISNFLSVPEIKVLCLILFRVRVLNTDFCVSKIMSKYSFSKSNLFEIFREKK